MCVENSCIRHALLSVLSCWSIARTFDELAPEPALLLVTFVVAMFSPSFFDSWSPSLDAANHRAPGSPVTPATFDDEPNAFQNASEWRCSLCDSVELVMIMGGWECLECGSTECYNVHQSMRRVTDNGTWLYMPHGTPPEASPSASSSRRRRRRRQRLAHGGSEGPSHHGRAEQAESEVMTHDTCVDPSISNQPSQSAEHREQARAPHGADASTGGE